LTYSSFLGVNSETGQNLDSASILYDSTARPSSATIWELPFSFWQTSFSQMLGTLLHEYGHVAGVNDAQEAAGVHVDMCSGKYIQHQ
jgi:hypothetical protein